jgi:hypothetical protein
MPVFSRLVSEFRKVDARQEAVRWLDRTDALIERQERALIKNVPLNLAESICCSGEMVRVGSQSEFSLNTARCPVYLQKRKSVQRSARRN